MTLRRESSTLVRIEVEVNRDDLERNDCKRPEDWEPEDLGALDGLGLIYSWELLPSLELGA